MWEKYEKTHEWKKTSVLVGIEKIYIENLNCFTSRLCLLLFKRFINLHIWPTMSITHLSSVDCYVLINFIITKFKLNFKVLDITRNTLNKVLWKFDQRPLTAWT